MIKSLLASLCTAALLALAPQAQAATVADTGTPGGDAIGALAFDAFDWVAGQVSFTQAAQIEIGRAHV